MDARLSGGRDCIVISASDLSVNSTYSYTLQGIVRKV